MKKIAIFIGKLPFVGKLVIRPVIFGLYQSQTFYKRLIYYCLLVVILLYFVFVHGSQMISAIKYFNLNSSFILKGVCCVFAVVNFCVTLTQLYLIYRSTCFFIKGKYLKKIHHYRDYSFLEKVIMFVTTLSGQIIAIFSCYQFF